jgi:hypothetical protein
MWKLSGKLLLSRKQNIRMKARPFATPSTTALTGAHSGSNSFIRDDSSATKLPKLWHKT